MSMNKTQLRTELEAILDQQQADDVMLEVKSTDYAKTFAFITNAETGTPEENAQTWLDNAKTKDTGSATSGTKAGNIPQAENPDYENVVGTIVDCKWQAPTDGIYVVPSDSNPNPNAMRFNVVVMHKDDTVTSVIGTHKVICRALGIANNVQGKDYPDEFKNALIGANVLIEASVFHPNKPYTLTQVSKDANGKRVVTIIGKKQVIKTERYLSELTLLTIKSELQKEEELMRMVLANNGGKLDANAKDLIAALATRL